MTNSNMIKLICNVYARGVDKRFVQFDYMSTPAKVVFMTSVVLTWIGVYLLVYAAGLYFGPTVWWLAFPVMIGQDAIVIINIVRRWKMWRATQA